MSLPEGPHDELGVLLRRFNRVTGELAKNIDSVGTVHNHLSDLDVSHLRTFSRYATLLIDHNHIYRELAERRKGTNEYM